MMKRIFLGLFAMALLCSHVMYLKMDSYFLEPNTTVQIKLFNGTFDKSENVIDRDRMIDVSILGNGNRTKVDDSQWTEKDSITLLNFQTGEAGTWISGVSTAPRAIEMDAETFNTYLEHEGILDMLAWRRENNAMEGKAVEKYSKHVKTIFQVGDKRSEDWKQALGYPIEFVPLENPYDLNTGDSLRFKLLFNGKPLANQFVYANHKAAADGHSHDDAAEKEHSHGDDSTHEEHPHLHSDQTNESDDHSHHDKTEKGHRHENGADEHSHSKKEKQTSEHGHDNKSKHAHHSETEDGHSHEATTDDIHTSGQQLRTDAYGIASAHLTADGVWYLQTIHLANTEEEGFTHESNWATLTFEVTHGHGEDTHTHVHVHEDEEGIPSWVYWIGSFVLVGLLFFWFNRKN